MHARNKETVFAQDVVHAPPHTGHETHVYDDIRRVRDLDAYLCDRRSQGTHGERHDIEDATAHAAAKETLQRGTHFDGSHPIVGRAGILLAFAADEGAIFYARHIVGIRPGQPGIGALFG